MNEEKESWKGREGSGEEKEQKKREKNQGEKWRRREERKINPCFEEEKTKKGSAKQRERRNIIGIEER